MHPACFCTRHVICEECLDKAIKRVVATLEKGIMSNNVIFFDCKPHVDYIIPRIKQMFYFHEGLN